MPADSNEPATPAPAGALAPGAPRLEVRELTKRFPGVLALDRVDLELYRGEVLAVIGENGAGKSTLMKILAGIEPLDSGEVLLEGRPVTVDSVRTAEALGIVLIHQELNLADNLEVGANLFLGREPHGRLGLIDQRTIRRASTALLARVGLDVAPGTPLGQLSLGQQQMVEIAKALAVDARILIMDEPTSSLSQHETERLFEVVRELRSRDVSIVYISHRLGEVKEVADRVVVLRDGRNAGDIPREEIEHDRMVSLMVGRDLAGFYAHQPHPPGAPLLEVENLRTPAHPQHPLTFQVRAGEIVGIAGLVGAGRTELLTTLFGIERPVDGSLRVAGQPLALASPQDALSAGIALVPEDRKASGLILEMAVRENTTLASLAREQRRGFIPRRRERKLAAEMIEKLSIRTPSDRQEVQYLSGGNQQKVVIGKWLALRPRVLLLDEPTRGVDVGAKEEIYRIMEQLSTQGVAVLFASSEMEEVLALSDRVLVMHEGRLAGELARGELTEEAVMQLATGAVSEAQP